MKRALGPGEFGRQDHQPEQDQGDTGSRQHQQHAGGHWQADQTNAAQRANDEQQRVAGQKRHHYQTGLDKHDGKQQGVDPSAIGLHKDLQMAVHMQNEVNQKSE